MCVKKTGKKKCIVVTINSSHGPCCYIWESPTYILNEDTHPVVRAIGVSHTACRDEFRQNLRSHSWSVFLFLCYSVSYHPVHYCCTCIIRILSAADAGLVKKHMTPGTYLVWDTTWKQLMFVCTAWVSSNIGRDLWIIRRETYIALYPQPHPGPTFMEVAWEKIRRNEYFGRNVDNVIIRTRHFFSCSFPYLMPYTYLRAPRTLLRSCFAWLML